MENVWGWVTLVTGDAILHELDTGRTGTGVTRRRRGEKTQMTAFSIGNVTWVGSQEGEAKKIYSIRLVRHNSSPVTSPGQATAPLEGMDKGEVSQVTSKHPMQNRFTELEYDYSSAPSIKFSFASAVDVTTGRGNYWAAVINITKSFNTYHCSLRLITNITIEDIVRRLGGVSEVKYGLKSIFDTGTTHNRDPIYGSIMSYYHSCSGDYITL